MTLVGLKLATGGSTQLRGVDDVVRDSLVKNLFSGNAFQGAFSWLAAHGFIDRFDTGLPKVAGIPVSILWFTAIAAAATWILLRTRVGNWIYASGGDANAPRNSGVPVSHVKTGLFMLTATAAALVAILTVLDAGSTDARRGVQKGLGVIFITHNVRHAHAVGDRFTVLNEVKRLAPMRKRKKSRWTICRT